MTRNETGDDRRGADDSPALEVLSRRERQIMDIVYANGKAIARRVWEDLPDAPTYATVRTLLRVLVEKGQLKHLREGRRFVYLPTKPREIAARSAWRRMIDTFYGGSIRQAIAGLLESDQGRLEPHEIEEIESLLHERESDAQDPPIKTRNHPKPS